MENFELLRNVTIGQYIPTGSVIHRLDPRAKLLSAIFLILAISFNVSIIANLLFLVVMFVIALLSRVPLSYIMRGFLLGLPVLVFIFVMQFLFLGRVEPAGLIYFEWGWFRVTRYSLHLIIISLLRITSLIFLTSLMTMTSTTTELTHGVESLLKPFRRLGVPSHELALILMITLRFVPTLAEEMERIMKAQASRGADIGTAPHVATRQDGPLDPAAAGTALHQRLSPGRRSHPGHGGARLRQRRGSNQVCDLGEPDHRLRSRCGTFSLHADHDLLSVAGSEGDLAGYGMRPGL